ncbi:hypothetical protein [Butyricicoccus sp.]|uniref:hypothetical protein n=1 Tax=Butyricicoccus sp. TaxID=2049021 RepID=UPI003F19282C
MILLEQQYQWTAEDTASDVPFAFACPAGVRAIRISFSFSPGKEQSEARCKPQIEDALARYYDRYSREIQPMTVEQYIPIKNLITLSLAWEGIYLGNAHRWAPQQEHLITAAQASRGFVPPERLEGSWTGMLHLHEILSARCTGQLRIEGRME